LRERLSYELISNKIKMILGFVLGGDVVRLMHGNMDHCITTLPPDSQVIDDSGR
jgi:hypothetical protein